MKENILEISIKLWIERLAGISSSDIANRLEVDNVLIMSELEEMVEAGYGTINDNVKLVDFHRLLKNEFDSIEDSMVTQHVFFPSPSILKEYYEANQKSIGEEREYIIRQIKGLGQLELVYFDAKVLSKYLQSPDIYDVEDDVVAGTIKSNMVYYNQHYPDCENAQHEHYVHFRYGKRNLINQVPCVTAFLCDLGKLPFKEQLHWYSQELSNAQFLEFDVDFQAYVNRTFFGSWAKSNDPIKDLSKTINSINQTCTGLFRNSQNPNLTYPYANNKIAYNSCCSELYKLIDSENIKRNIVLGILKKLFNVLDTELVSKDGRPFSSLQTFYLLTEHLLKDIGYDGLNVDIYRDTWKEIREARIASDHGISSYTYDSVNYVHKFRNLVMRLDYLLEWVNTRFKNLIEGIEY